MELALKTLVEDSACSEYTDAFRNLFGGSAKITRDNLRKIIRKVADSVYDGDTTKAYCSLLCYFINLGDDFSEQEEEDIGNYYDTWGSNKPNITIKEFETRTLKLLKEKFEVFEDETN